MKTLPTQQALQELLSYDLQTGLLHWKERSRSLFTDDKSHKTWNTRYANKEAFTAVNSKGYRIGGINDTIYSAARIIYKLVHDIDAIQIDHSDGNRANNRITNLENVTGLMNQKNMKTPITNTSGHIGVTWDASRNKWAARIKVNSRHINLGRYAEFNDAVAARKQAELDHGFHPNHGR